MKYMFFDSVGGAVFLYSGEISIDLLVGVAVDSEIGLGGCIGDSSAVSISEIIGILLGMGFMVSDGGPGWKPALKSNSFEGESANIVNPLES